MVSGLIPPEMLDMMVEEAAVQFDQEVTWIQQQYDANGMPVETDDGDKVYQEPKYIPARAVTVYREMIDDQGIHRVEATQWYLPPNTGVAYGDQLIGKGDDPSMPPPILSVGQVPDPAASVFEVVTTSWRSRGAP